MHRHRRSNAESAPTAPQHAGAAPGRRSATQRWRTGAATERNGDAQAAPRPSCGVPHAFSFKFDSALDPATQVMRFTATAHGDLDGDGMVSTFEARGERVPGQHARVLPGMFIDREVE